METRSTARNRTSIDHGAEDAPAAETDLHAESWEGARGGQARRGGGLSEVEAT